MTTTNENDLSKRSGEYVQMQEISLSTDIATQDELEEGLSSVSRKIIKAVGNTNSMDNIYALVFDKHFTIAEDSRHTSPIPIPDQPGYLSVALENTVPGQKYILQTKVNLGTPWEDYYTFYGAQDSFDTSIVFEEPDNVGFFRTVAPDGHLWNKKIFLSVDTNVKLNSYGLLESDTVAKELQKYIPLTGVHSSNELSIIKRRSSVKTDAAIYGLSSISYQTKTSADVSSYISLYYPQDEALSVYESDPTNPVGVRNHTIATRDYVNGNYVSKTFLKNTISSHLSSYDPSETSDAKLDRIILTLSTLMTEI